MDLSVIITAYNYANYIEETINSVFEQDKHDLKVEVLLINDGSTDNTMEKIDKYKNIKDFTVLNINNSGIEKASNTGFRHAKGRFVVRLDADDKLKFNFMKTVQGFLQSDFDILYGDYSLIDKNSELIRDVKLPVFDKNELIERGDFLASGTVYKMRTIKRIGLYSEDVKNSGLENFELTLKLIETKAIFKKIDVSIFEYRQHSNSVSSTKKESIILFGSVLSKRFSLGEYTTNENHPYGLKI